MKCNRCGQEFDGNFCAHCGAPAPKKALCQYCGIEFDGRFCPNCGKPKEQQTPRGNIHQQRKPVTSADGPKKIKKWPIIVGVLATLIIIGALLGSDGDEGKSAKVTPTAKPSTAPQEPSKSPEEKAEEIVYGILKHHSDVASGNITEAEQKGAWFAYEINLALYDGLEHDACYYAMYGRDKFIAECGDSNLEKVEALIAKVRDDHQGEILTEEEFTAIAVEKAAAEALEKDEYIASATTVSYSSLIREPKKYEGTILKITVKISQLMEGGFLTENGYRAYSNGNEWYIQYDLSEDEPRIIEGDTVTFYGEFYGLTKITRALTGTSESVPKLTAKFRN